MCVRDLKEEEEEEEEEETNVTNVEARPAATADPPRRAAVATKGVEERRRPHGTSADCSGRRPRGTSADPQQQQTLREQQTGAVSVSKLV